MRLSTFVLAAGLAALAGCAATVQRAPADAGAAVRVPAQSSKNIVLNVTGSPAAVQSKDWEAFKGEWRSALGGAATAAGARFSAQDGAPRPMAEPGTLVVVDVADYRYLTPGARFGLGIMTGNAYIDTKVRFVDLRTGAPLGERAYNTSSSAWQGVFSAMTDKQVQAISKEIVSEINPRQP